MIYRLKRDSDKDPNHELGEPVTIARRAAKYIGRDKAPVTIEVYNHAEGIELAHMMRRHPELELATLVIHGRQTPEAVSAREDIGGLGFPL